MIDQLKGVRYGCFLLLGGSQLLLEGLGHLWWGRAGKTEPDLDGVVDEPLGSGESTNHDNPRCQSLPDSHEAEFLQGLAGGRPLGSVHLGDDSVGRMGDNSAEDTSDVTSSESDDELFTLGALVTGLGNDVPISSVAHYRDVNREIIKCILVEKLDGLFEASELHHGVRDLTHPQRNQALVESIQTFLPIG